MMCCHAWGFQVQVHTDHVRFMFVTLFLLGGSVADMATHSLTASLTCDESPTSMVMKSGVQVTEELNQPLIVHSLCLSGIEGWKVRPQANQSRSCGGAWLASAVGKQQGEPATAMLWTEAMPPPPAPCTHLRNVSVCQVYTAPSLTDTMYSPSLLQAMSCSHHQAVYTQWLT
jgi:hypothetical protein